MNSLFRMNSTTISFRRVFSFRRGIDRNGYSRSLLSSYRYHSELSETKSGKDTVPTSGSNYIKATEHTGKQQGQYFDFVEQWSRKAFFNTGYGMTACATGLSIGLGFCQETVIINSIVIGYWLLGYHDLTQKVNYFHAAFKT